MSRHRGTIILLAILFVELLVFGYQLRKNREVPLLRQVSVLVMSPLQKTFRTVSDKTWGVWKGYVDLRGARRENERLIQQLEDARLANQRLQVEADQGKRLKVLMDFKQQLPSQAMAAAVIGSSGTDTSQLIVIDKGSRDGLRPDMPVIVPDGVVGKVLRVFPTAAQVLLISDAESGVAVLLETSRVHGIIRGQNRTICKLGYVVSDDKVEIGEKVFTSGEDQIFPKGLPLGVVVEAKPASPFQDISVQPFAKLNRLEEVLIITSKVDVELPATAVIGPPLPGSAPTNPGAATQPSQPQAVRPASPAAPSAAEQSGQAAQARPLATPPSALRNAAPQPPATAQTTPQPQPQAAQPPPASATIPQPAEPPQTTTP